MKFKDFIAVAGEQSQNTAIIGQLLYMSIGAMLIGREKMAEIYEQLNLPGNLPKRLNLKDSFYSATTDISMRLQRNGRLIKVFVRDNLREKGGKVISRELVKEIVGDDNEYISLGKFKFDTESQTITYTIADYDPDIKESELEETVEKVEKLFELYKKSYNRNSVETILENLIGGLDASKVTTHGKLYFVPRYKMEDVAVIEALVEMLNENNELRKVGVMYTPISANAIPVTNDKKQCDNFARDFYNTVEKEIEEIQNRLQHFIRNGSKSEKVTEKWLEKIDSLKKKKANYEQVFNRALNGMNEEFENVEFLAAELKARVRSENFINGSRQMDGQVSLVA